MPRRTPPVAPIPNPTNTWNKLFRATEKSIRITYQRKWTASKSAFVTYSHHGKWSAIVRTKCSDRSFPTPTLLFDSIFVLCCPTRHVCCPLPCQGVSHSWPTHRGQWTIKPTDHLEREKEDLLLLTRCARLRPSSEYCRSVRSVDSVTILACSYIRSFTSTAQKFRFKQKNIIDIRSFGWIYLQRSASATVQNTQSIQYVIKMTRLATKCRWLLVKYYDEWWTCETNIFFMYSIKWIQSAQNLCWRYLARRVFHSIRECCPWLIGMT